MTTVYSTDWQCVTIDYNRTARRFQTTKEAIDFTPEKLFNWLNRRRDGVKINATQQLQVGKWDARCYLTPEATNALAHIYQNNLRWQDEYPNLASLFLPSVGAKDSCQ
jgi:hypothetical protein